MIDFKQQLALDIDTFINPSEFADIHSINGQEVNAIIDSNALDEVAIKTESMQAVFVNAITIFIPQGSLSRLPLVDEDFELDGYSYTCKGLRIEQGCDAIIAVENQSR